MPGGELGDRDFDINRNIRTPLVLDADYAGITSVEEVKAWLTEPMAKTLYSPHVEAGNPHIGSGLLRVTPVMLRQWRVKPTTRSALQLALS